MGARSVGFSISVGMVKACRVSLEVNCCRTARKPSSMRGGGSIWPVFSLSAPCWSSSGDDRCRPPRMT